ncbi:MAG: exosortase B [Sulfuricella sp.]|nr:exosortase B [Gammaproteobacteria bacterium]
MNTIVSRLPGTGNLISIVNTWWPVLLGLVVLYFPTYWMLANGLWSSEDYAHGPIVLIVFLFLIWQKRDMLQPATVDSRSTGTAQTALGWVVLIFGLLAYAVGRSQDILLFEVGSQVPVILGALLITQGMHSVKALWFALFFLLFMIPLPGFVVDAATGPLKQYISVLAENVLYFFGYPIARNGVILTVGPYQLLVADACSGLHSMFSLSAMGALYLYLMQHTSRTRSLVLIAAILPIAFFANVVRVIILILVTYYFGDEAGQGFLHGFAGVLLFIIALLMLFALDGLLGFILPDRSRSKAHP